MTDNALTEAEATRLTALENASSLADLLDLTGTTSVDRAYHTAKDEWRTLKDKALPDPSTDDSAFPGDTVVIDGHSMHVHGITHTDTDAERDFVRRHMSSAVEDGAFVYTEQGVRPMYFDDFEHVCGMDDFTWALQQCTDLAVDSRLKSIGEIDSLLDNLSTATDELRSAVFSLIESSEDVVGEQASRTFGDVATTFLTRPSDLSIGRNYTSFMLSKQAARDPTHLEALQRYYRTAFLPQPVEREWLRRHDPELEMTTHARNERMADYVVHHNEEATQVHVIVGAAHQPGVTYYLEQYRDGIRTEGAFELLG